MSIPKPPYAEGQEFTNDVTGVTYKFDGVKWIAAGSGEEIDLSGYVRKEGGDSMEGPLNMRPQAGADTRQTNRVQTLGVYSNSAASSLRLGTDRDRIYVGSNDTSFNGPIKVAELQEKNAGGGISTTHKIVVRANGIVERPVPSGTAGDGFAFQGRVEGGSATEIKDKLLSVYHNSGDEPDAVNYQGKTSNPDNIQSRKSVLSITDPIQDGVDQNAADIRTLFQEIQAIAKPLGGGYYFGISVSTVNNGQFHLASGSYAATGTTTLTFHQYDQNGVSRGWGDADPGDYIVLQARNSDNFGVYEVVRVTQFSDKFAIEVEQVEGKGTHMGDTLVNLYNLSGSEIPLNELDQRYLRKDVQQTTTGLLKFELSTGMCLAAHDDSWQIWRDGTFVTARTTFSSNHLVTQNYVSSNFAAKNHNHDGAYAPIDHTHDFSVDDATQTKKGIAFLGQAITGTSTAPSLKSGQLYWNTSNKTLYIGN